MLLWVIGPPSPLLERTREALTAIFNLKVGALAVCAVSTPAEIASALAQNSPKNIALQVSVVTAAIAKLIDQALCPVIFVGDHLDRVMVRTRNNFAIDELNALRYISKGLASAQAIASSKRTLKVPKIASDSDATLVRVLAAYLGVSLLMEEEDAVLHQLTPRVTANVEAVRPSALNSDTISASYRALRAYEPIMLGRTITRLEWPIAMFNVPDPAAASPWEAGTNIGFVASRFDLTGPGRLLFFGPYLCLPPGNWKVTTALSVQGNRTGNTLQIDSLVHPDDAPAAVLFEAQTDLPNDGKFAASFVLSSSDGTAPISIRAFLMRGSIDVGALEFIGTTIERA